MNIFLCFIDKFDSLRSQDAKIAKSEEFFELDSKMIESGAEKTFRELSQTAQRKLATISKAEMKGTEVTDESVHADAENVGVTKSEKNLFSEYTIFALQSFVSESNDSKSSTYHLLSDCLFMGTVPVGNGNLSKEIKYLMKTIIWGLKQIIAQLASSRFSEFAESVEGVANGFGFDIVEINYLSKYFSLGLQCVNVLYSTKLGNDHKIVPVESSDTDNKNEAKEIIELFSNSFFSVDSSIIRHILERNLDLILELGMKESMFLGVIQQFLSNSKHASHAFDVLLSFLVSKLKHLSHPVTMYHRFSSNERNSSSYINGQRSSILLRLFKFAFGSVTLNQSNEIFLRSRLRTIIMMCLNHAQESRVSVNYYFVLRTLFKSVTTLKSDACYYEISSLIPALLNGLRQLLVRTRHEAVQNILIELCLTIPAKLRALIPHFQDLLDLLIRALHIRVGELSQLGLRTFEFWIENMSHDNLQKLLCTRQGTLGRLMQGICIHLKPLPHPYGMLALRILGKLGGINRSFLRDHPFKHSSVSTSEEEYASLFVKCHCYLSKEIGPESCLSEVDIDISSFVDASCEFLYNCSSKALVEAEISTLEASYTATDGSTKTEEAHFPPGAGLKSLLMGQTLDHKMDQEYSSELTSEANCLTTYCSDKLKRSSISFVLLALSKTFFFRNISRQSLDPVHLNISNGISRHPQGSLGYPEYEIESKHLNADDKSCIRLILVLLISCADRALHDDSLILLRGVCHHFVNYSKAAASRRLNSCIDRIHFIIHEVIMISASDFRPSVHKISNKFLNFWVHGCSEIERSDGHVYLDFVSAGEGISLYSSQELVSDLLTRIELYCKSTNDLCRIGGLRVLDWLCGFSNFPWHFCRSDVVLRSIFSVIEIKDSAYSVVLLMDCMSLLGKIASISTLFLPPSPVEPNAMEVVKETGVLNKSCFTLLMDMLAHSSICLRKLARHYFQELSRANSVSIGIILHPFKDDLNAFYINRITRTGISAHLGLISSIYFLQSSDIDVLNDSIVAFMGSLIRLSTQMNMLSEHPFKDFRFSDQIPCDVFCESSLLVSYFPETVPHSVLLRLLIIHLIGVVYSTEVIGSGKFTEFRSQCITLLTKSIDAPFSDIASAACTTLEIIIKANSHEASHIGQSLVNVHIQPIVESIQQQSIGIIHLKCFRCVLMCTSNIFYIELGEKLLEFLKKWIDCETSIDMSTQSSKDGTNVALSIMETFHLLPWSSIGSDHEERTNRFSPFFHDLVDTMRRLEKKRSSFAHRTSVGFPFLQPFAKFLSRQPMECFHILFQSDYLRRQEVCCSLPFHFLLPILS